MILPSHDFTVTVDATFKAVPSRRTVMIVLHVFLAAPGHLDGFTAFLSNRRTLHQIITDQAPAEPATYFGDVNDDIFSGNSQMSGHEVAPPTGELGGGPNFGTIGRHDCRAILRLKVGVRCVGVSVIRIDGLFSIEERLRDISIVAKIGLGFAG